MEISGILRKEENSYENCEGISEPIFRSVSEILWFLDLYKANFPGSTKPILLQAQKELCGLIQAKNKTIERMAEIVPDSDEQVPQHFRTYSPCSYCAVMDQVASDTGSLFGDNDDPCLIFDESGILKKYGNSGGVGRQRSSQLGKGDKCKVGVFVTLACGSAVPLVDIRLSLPERCKLAGIPQEHFVQKSTYDLALEEISHTCVKRIRFNCVGVDSR